MKRMIERRFTVTIVTDSMRNTANQALQSDEDRNMVSLISCSSNVSGRYYLLKSKKKCINHARSVLITQAQIWKSFWVENSTNLLYLLISSPGETWKIEITDGLVIKWEGACMNGLRSTIGTHDFHKTKLPPFLNTPTRPGIIRSGKRLRLLIETLTSTLVVKKAIHRSLHPNNSQQGQWNWDSWSVDAYDQTT